MEKINIDLIINKIKSELILQASEKNREGMARFGIRAENALGTGMGPVREIAKRYRRNHPLALALWQTGVHELRILAAWVDDPAEVTQEQMELWVKNFNSWDVCDQVCMRLFCRSRYAQEKVIEWSMREGEFERRAAFALVASMAIHLKKSPDTDFLVFFPLIEAGALDERHLVSKAVDWALRQLGKRSEFLREKALAMAQQLSMSESRPARRVGNAVNSRYKRESAKRQSTMRESSHPV